MRADLVARFAERWGCDGAMMGGPEESHESYRITGGEGRDPASYDGEIEALWLQFNGRWGNYVYQLIHIFHLAELLHVKQVFVIRTEMFEFDKIQIGPVTVCSHSHAPDPGLYCLYGAFFSPAPFGRLMDSLSADRRAYLAACYVRKLLVPLTRPTGLAGPDVLMIHIRSGDLFAGEDGACAAVGGASVYVQPPLQFYLMTIERALHGRTGHVVIVAEDAGNPVILALVSALGTGPHALTLRLGHSLPGDLAWLLSAEQVVFANGSIGIAVALLSDAITTGFFFRHNTTGTMADISDYLGSKLQRHIMIDVDNDYLQMGQWTNTRAQRDTMLSFPRAGLAWAGGDPPGPPVAAA